MQIRKKGLHGNPYLNSSGGSTQIRTGDTRIFSPMLYLLSYRAKMCGGPDETRTRDLLCDREAC